MAEIYKVLGQSAPGATTNTNLYTVPSGKQAVASSIVVANRSSTAANYRIAIRPAGAAIANQHYMAFDVTVPGLDSTTITVGITLAATDIVTVYASNANLTFLLFGSEIDL
jgi:glucose-6-phosphate dehydrogenase assembly protein OpcA